MSDSKTSKKTAASKKVETVAAPVAAPATPAPATEKKVRAKKETAAPVPAKVEAVVPTVAAASAPAEETSSASAESRLQTVVDRLRDAQSKLSTELKEIAKEAMAAVKAASREIKDAKKRKRTKKVEEMTAEEKKAWETRRANNAFLKPRALTPELCSFMGIAAGSQRSQTEVTKFVATYVKSHNCFDPANKRRIIPDAALARLLRVTDKDTVTYLNLQSYLKSHFVKTA
jgi:chromatin remodeling complex protein RSC6